MWDINIFRINSVPKIPYREICSTEPFHWIIPVKIFEFIFNYCNHFLVIYPLNNHVCMLHSRSPFYAQMRYVDIHHHLSLMYSMVSLIQKKRWQNEKHTPTHLRTQSRESLRPVQHTSTVNQVFSCNKLIHRLLIVHYNPNINDH